MCARINDTRGTFLDKGGVGKTTVTAHFAVVLDRQGLDILMLDLAGKQGDLAKHFGLWEEIQADDDRWPNITTVFQDEWDTIAEKLPMPVEELITTTAEGPDLIPAHETLDGLNSTLGNIDDSTVPYSRLDEFLTEYIDERYDVVLLDLPGSTSNVSYNGPWAAQHVIAPVRPGSFETGQAAQLRRDLEAIQEGRGVTIELVMVS